MCMQVYYVGYIMCMYVMHGFTNVLCA